MDNKFTIFLSTTKFLLVLKSIIRSLRKLIPLLGGSSCALQVRMYTNCHCLNLSQSRRDKKAKSKTKIPIPHRSRCFGTKTCNFLCISDSSAAPKISSKNLCFYVLEKIPNLKFQIPNPMFRDQTPCFASKRQKIYKKSKQSKKSKQ